MAAKKRRDLRILWSSNGFFTNSGYGVETREILGRLLDDGWIVGHIAFYGLESFPQMMDIPSPKGGQKIKVYPKMAHPYGSDALINCGIDFKAHVIFTMQDVWPLDPNHLRRIKMYIPYVPIDQEPVPPEVIMRLRFANRIITFSRYGQAALEKAGLFSDLILEGTNVNTFKPLDKKKMREKFKLPQDIFLFGVIGANKDNPPRKSYQEMIEAFNIFQKRHPEARMMFHTQQHAPGGFPIIPFAKHLGCNQKIFFIEPVRGTHFFDSEKICQEINAFDVCLHTSQTEGFGLVIIEAQACGVPIIVTRGMSMPELVIEGKTGEIAEVASKRFSPAQGYWVVPSVPSIVEKMEILYKKLHQKNTIAKDCRKWIADNYNIDTIVKEKWIPYLEKLQKKILTPVKKSDKVIFTR